MKNDVYASVTNAIIASMETALKSRQRWRMNPNNLPMPINAGSGKRYGGINVLRLWLAARDAGYKAAEWGTYRCWASKGKQVKGGEKGTGIVWFKTIETENADEESETFHVARYFVVFNAEQLSDYVPAPEPVSLVPLPERLAHCEAFIAATGATIVHGGDVAAYAPQNDTILMPDLSRFDDNVSYYGVAGHELCHWTGAPSRLARPMSFDHKSEEYAFEELIAEIGASYLAADWQIEITPREDHAAYLQSWLKALRNNKKMIFRAASAAAKACAYLHGLQPKGERT